MNRPRAVATNFQTNPKPPIISSTSEFRVWKGKFDRYIGIGEPSSKALRKWMEHVDKIRSAEYLRVFPDADALYPDTDLRTAVLADLYRQTLPPDRKAMREREKHTESILLMLKNLAVAAESFIAVLERTGIYVYTEDGLLPIGLKSVLEPCEALARSSRYLIGVVRRPHTHKPNLVRQCVPLFVFLTKELKVTDEQALA
jgi:hypothetical protein